METVSVELGARSYPIHIGAGLIDRAELLAPHLPSPWALPGFGQPLRLMGAQATLRVAGGLTTTQFNLNTAVGLALQAGFDYMIDRNWGINFDVKKLILRPGYNATVNNTIPVSGTAALDPWLFGVGVTYRF